MTTQLPPLLQDAHVLFPAADTNTDCKTCRIEREAMQDLTLDSSLHNQGIFPIDVPRKKKLGDVITIFTTRSLTTNTLCERCKSLDIWVSQSLRTTPSVFDTTHSNFSATITKQSICAGCSLCRQLNSVFQYIESIVPGSERSDHLRLSWASGAGFEGHIRASHLFYFSCVLRFFPVRYIGPSPIRGAFCSFHPDYQFIRAQLKIYRETHDQKCTQLTTGEQVLRVIDCKSHRLTTVKLCEPYICLSYVWGSSTTQDAREFGDELPASIPRTVEDAMDVAISLGIPYLWVDRYCIDQSNHEEKHRLIKNMNKIYEQAEVTIIAAAIGDDPHYGLPGVQDTLREEPITIELGGKTFVTVADPLQETNKTKWSSRGWTFQEMLLSRRRLVFTRTQMYFQCRNVICMESLNPDYTDYRRERSSLISCFPLGGIGETVDDLLRQLEEYFRRKLSFGIDSILAFDGVVNAFDESESFPFRVKQFYGVLLLHCDENKDMARRSFISNICWCLDWNHHVDSHGGGATNVFPSWSWASAKASQSPGKLYHNKHSGDPLQHDDIKVCVTKKQGIKMDLCEFMENEDSHELFLPSMEMTTWVLRYPFDRTSKDHDKYWRYAEFFEIKPREDCHTLHLAYLRAYSKSISDLRMVALIVEESRPGVFRRVGLWTPTFREIEFPASITTYDMLTRTLEELKKEEYEKLWLPHGEGAVSEMKWEKRTLTLV